MQIIEFRLKFHWSLFLMFQLRIFQHWFRKWLGADQATSHYLKQWWLNYRRTYASFGLNELRSFFVAYSTNEFDQGPGLPISFHIKIYIHQSTKMFKPGIWLAGSTAIGLFHKSRNAPVPCPIMPILWTFLLQMVHHWMLVQCIWDFWDGSIGAHTCISVLVGPSWQWGWCKFSLTHCALGEAVMVSKCVNFKYNLRKDILSIQ